MRRNVLIKKNKILALVLAAAMAFPSAPMHSVYAEEANGTVTEDVSQEQTPEGESQEEATDGESQKEATDGESQKEMTDGEVQKEAAGDEVMAIAEGDEAEGTETPADTENWTTILNMGFDDEGTKADHVTIDGTVNTSDTDIGGNSSQKLFFNAANQTVMYKLGNGYDSGKVKIVVETYSTSKTSNTGDDKKDGQLGFRVLDTGEGEDQHALINIGHFGGVNLYTTDVTGEKSTENNDNDSSKKKDLQYLALTSKDDTVTASSDTNRGRWIRLETVIDLDNPDKDGENEILNFTTTVYRKNTADNEWVEHKTVTGATYNLKDGDWGNGTASMVKPVAQTKGCANDDAVFEVGAIVFQCKAANAYVDNITIKVTGEPKKEAEKPTLTNVTMTKPPTNTEYANGEALDLTGLELTETYSDESTKVLDTPAKIEAAYDISDYDSQTAGTQTVKLTSKADAEQKITFTVTVAKAVPVKYILAYQGEDNLPDTALGSISGKIKVVAAAQNKPTKILQFSSTGTANATLTAPIESGIAVVEFEMNPASKSQESVVFYNQAGDTLFTVGAFCENVKDGNKGVTLHLTDKRDLTTGTKLVPLMVDSDGKDIEVPVNCWIYGKAIIDLGSTSDGVLQWSLQMAYHTNKKYSADYNDEGWIYGPVITQADLIAKGDGYKNGTVTDTIDGSSEHPFNLRKLDLWCGTTARFMGDIKIYNITGVTFSGTPGKQKQGEPFDPGDVELTVSYSTGYTDEPVKLSKLVLDRDYTVPGFEDIKAGNGQEVTISYMGFDYKTTVDVESGDPVTLKSIEIGTAPSQKYVEMGKTLNTSDMVVNAVYSNGKKEPLAEDKYTVTFDNTSTGKKTVTVTAKDSEGVEPATFDVIVTIVSTTENLKNVFTYNTDIDADELAGLGFTDKDGNPTNLLSLSDAEVANNKSQKLLLGQGTVKKSWGYELTEGIVKIVLELNQNTKNAEYRILDKDGKALINIGQFSNTNIYAGNVTGGSTAIDGKNYGNPYETVISGAQKERWLKLDTEIDLTASNATGKLQFKTLIYRKESAEGGWTYMATVTGEDYSDVTKWKAKAEPDSNNKGGQLGGTAHENGCATDGIGKGQFSVGSIELAASESSVVLDNIEILATDAATLKKAEVNSDGLTKKDYIIGDKTPDWTGLVLRETYENGKGITVTKELTAAEIEKQYKIEGFDTTSAGEKTIKLTNNDNKEVTCEFKINVRNAKIVSIHVTGPSKTNYFVGDTELNLEGLVVKAVYSDDLEKQVTLTADEYTVGDLEATEAGTKVITVTSKTENAEGKKVTATFNVTIKAPEITGIEVTKKPSKLSYNLNQATSLDTTGMVVMAIYDNNTKKEISAGYSISGFDASKETDSQTIIVTYMGKTAEFTIMIVDPSKFKPIEFAFDFNAGGSKTAEGWTGIDVNPKSGSTYNLGHYGYTEEKGYGIVTNVTALRGRSGEAVLSKGDYVSISKDVYTDYVLLANANTTNLTDTKKYVGQFNVDIENGTYNVMIIVGTVNSNTTAVKIEDTYTGSATISSEDVKNFKVIEIPNVVVSDKQMNIVTTEDGNARTNGIIISNISAPTGLEGKLNASKVNVTLSWNESLGCAKYNVYRYGADGTIKCLGAAEGTTYTDTDVAVLETYTYYVRGVSQKGLETFASNEVSVEIKDENAQKPEKPVNVKAEPEEDKTTITWDAVKGAAYYEVYWSDRDRTSFEGTRYETSGLESYELLGTSTSTTYVLELPTHIERYFKVVAVNSAGQSKPSDPVMADIVKVFNTQTEKLDRGLVAIKTDYGIYLGWRLAKDEYEKGATYKLYRDGECIRTFTVSDNTSYLDKDEKGTVASKYAVSVVIDGTESDKCEEVSVWENPYMEVKLNQPEPYYDSKLTKEHVKSVYTDADARVNLSTGDYVYTPNDTYIGDVDGDGEYELIVKWDGLSRDNSLGGYTSPVIIDCYKLNGTQLWRIDLGINIRAGAHYTQPVVADFDGDGKAEIMIRTADGSSDAKGTVIGDGTADHRNTGSGNKQGQILDGKDYLTLFDGETGVILDTIEYIPQRGTPKSWGDEYGNRCERYLSGAAYLDGEHISAIFDRGYYTRAVVAAFTVKDDKIVHQWTIDSNTAGNSSLAGQGAHSFTVADVDGDGCQEIIFGSATIDHDGTLLYSLKDTAERFSGHGDALRVTDMNLTNPGLEAAMCKEDKPGAAMWDAGTGELLYGITAPEDVGRASAGDIDPYHEGGEFWFNGANGGLHAADGEKLANRPSSINHMVWFDGTMGRNFLDGSYDKGTGLSSGFIAKWEVNESTGKGSQIDVIRDAGVEVNNTTKSNPCFQADIFGDWREEVGFRTDDNQNIRIYTSTEVMDYRLYSLMQDPTYRAQMACNGSAYNQSPDAGFYIGYDTALMQVPGGANYLALNGALERAKDLDPADYTAESYADLETAVKAVVTGLPKSSQADVDAMAKAVEDALAALVVLNPADYTAVDAALAKVKELEANADIYKNYDAVEAACEAVKRGYPKSKQDKVDAMAQAIEDAIAALKVKGADYTAVDAALEKVKGLIAEDYENFDAVEAAIAAVEQDLPMSEQDKVDAMAAAIEKAIAELVESPADYTAVDAAIEKAGKLNPDDYVNYAEVEANINAAIEAVKRGLLKSRQETVNDMAKAIEDAIAALEKKPESTATPEPGTTETPEPGATETPEPGATATPEPGATETPEPGTEPSPAPSIEPTPAPTVEPTQAPDTEPDDEPDEEPDEQPTPEPAAATPAPGVALEVNYNVQLAIPENVLTEAVKNVTGCNTVEALTQYMKQDVIAKAQSASKGITQDNIEVREIAVTVTLDGGKTWQPVTKETFPSNGVKIVLQYPAGTNKDEYDFVVSHMITMDRDDLNLKAGMIVNENYVKTDAGLELNIMSASPFAIGWSKIVETNQNEPGVTTPGKTGDNMYAFLWMWAVVLVGAGCIIAFMVVKRRRNR